MSRRTIIGISRGSEYSPNHIDNDKAIFDEVTATLQTEGYAVNTYTEKEFVASHIAGDIIFNMARDRATIRRLKELEDKGVLVINSAYGIENCVRKPMTERLVGHGVPHPKSLIIDLSSVDLQQINNYPCWIKRGDSHAIVKEDVCYVTNQQEAESVFNDFISRGIPTAVINEHLRGDLIKFYGIRGLGFFFWFYPSPCMHSKFGLERINGEAEGILFLEEELKEYCEKASQALAISVYGGDCVVRPDGTIIIIDFNDWPSFARCRQEAGHAIAAHIVEQMNKTK